MVIVRVLNICQDDFIPWQVSEDLCVLPCDLHASVVSCAGMRARPLCIRCSLCSDQFVVVLTRVWRSCSSVTAAAPSSESGLGLGDVDFDAVGALRGGVLPYWRRSLGRHQPFPGLLPLLVHSRVHAPVLPRRKPGLWRLLWHGWWKLLVFILQIRRKRRYSQLKVYN